MATRSLIHNGDHQPLGKRWITSFLIRHPHGSFLVSRSIEVARAEAATPEVIHGFLDLFYRTRTKLGIRDENV